MLKYTNSPYFHRFTLGIPNEEQLIQNLPPSEKFEDHPSSHMDLDFERPAISGLDDTYRPRIDGRIQLISFYRRECRSKWPLTFRWSMFCHYNFTHFQIFLFPHPWWKTDKLLLLRMMSWEGRTGRSMKWKGQNPTGMFFWRPHYDFSYRFEL